MKSYTRVIILAITIMLTAISCRKDASPAIQYPARTITFILHTEKNLSDDNHNIIFSLFIKNHSRTLFDSTLSSMKIKDIPDSMHKLIFKKEVPGDDGSDIAAGFNYVIEGVGNSWYLDSCKASETFKVIDFSFK